MYEALRKDEQFDVITGNLPFRDKKAFNKIEATMWDTNLRIHTAFFKGAKKHLKPNGRIYLSQANFGAIYEMRQMAEKHGFSVKLIGLKTMSNDLRKFYAYELKCNLISKK